MNDEYGRLPCPMRILDDAGGGFCLGILGGGLLNGVRGFQNSPSGLERRWKSGLSSIRMLAPRTGGSFASWAGVFSICECSILGIRGIHDPWSSITSGAITGALLAVRQGPRSMAGGAAVGGCILAVIEGVGLMLNRVSAPIFAPEPEPEGQGIRQYN